MADALQPIPLAPVPKKRARWGRRLGCLFLIVLVLLGVLVWAAPGLIAKSDYRHQLLKDATSDLDGTIEVGGLSLAWFSPVGLHDVVVKDKAGQVIASIPNITTSKTLLDFAQNRSDLGMLKIDQPKINVVVANGTTNIETLLAKYLKPSDTPSTTKPTLEVQITQGTVSITAPESNQSGTLNDFASTIKLTKDSMTGSVQAKSNESGTLDAQFDLAGTSKIKAEGFQLAAISPLLPRLDPKARVRGLLSSDMALSWSGTEQAEINGTIGVNDLSLKATALKDDTFTLDRIQLPAKASYKGGVVTVEQSELTCDVGSAKFRGTVDTNNISAILQQPNLELDANVDLAKVAKKLPGTLHLKPGTEITGGQLIAKLNSQGTAPNISWDGSLRSTSLTGQRDGKPLAWEQPLNVTFKGKLRDDGWPSFENVTVLSDVIKAQARGEIDNFVVVANLDLDRLATRLADFVDMGTLKIGGEGKNLLVQLAPEGHSDYRMTANGTLKNFILSDGTTTLANEKLLTINAEANGRKHPTDGTYNLRAATATVKADTDELTMTLLEPVENLAKPMPAKAKVNLLGDLARWRGRMIPVVALPNDWIIRGTARTATAIVTIGDTIVATDVQLVVQNAQFTGAGINLNEPDLFLSTADPKTNPKLKPDEVGSITIRKTGATEFRYITIRSETLSGATERFDITVDAQGRMGMNGSANVVTRLDRLQTTLQLPAKPTEAETFRGIANGRVTLNAPTFDNLGLVADMSMEHVSYGLVAKPLLFESWIKLKANAIYDLKADELNIKSAELSREGLTITTKGTVKKLTSAVELNVDGDLGYNFAKLEPELRKMLGASATAKGEGTRPFRATGTLIGKDAALELTGLNAGAGVNWQSLKAYGFDVGEGELKATVQNGIAKTNPINTSFGGGNITLEPSLNLNPGRYDLSFQPGAIISKAKLTPAVCAEALGYALPAIANSAQADGTFSFDLGDNLIPLADYTKMRGKANLTIHEANVAPGPVVTQLVEALGMQTPKMQLTKGNVVPIEIKDGRVYHKDFLLNISGTSVTSAGSVGLDGSLDVTLTVPVGGFIAEKLLPNNPLIQKALVKQTISVPVGGTMSKPNLNRDAMKGQLSKIVERALKDAGQGAVEDVFKKGLEGFLKPKK